MKYSLVVFSSIALCIIILFWTIAVNTILQSSTIDIMISSSSPHWLGEMMVGVIYLLLAAMLVGMVIVILDIKSVATSIKTGNS